MTAEPTSNVSPPAQILQIAVKHHLPGIQILHYGSQRNEEKCNSSNVKELKGKKEVTKEKNKLREIKVFIDDDQTKKEREIQKPIEKKAKRQEKEGKRIKVGYRAVWMDGTKEGVFGGI
ncbi:hypothetical protein FQR65_LT09175 [Abscondita terminalis]|nr:hypothetical protein FQR65_LT09175 [Abscondita terminalis]